MSKTLHVCCCAAARFSHALRTVFFTRQRLASRLLELFIDYLMINESNKKVYTKKISTTGPKRVKNNLMDMQKKMTT